MKPLSVDMGSIQERISSLLTGVLIPVCLLVIWDLSVRWHWVPSTLVASPLMTLQALIAMIQDGRLAANCGISLERLFLGFALGIAIGIVSGLAVGINRLSAKLFDPTIAVLAPIPAIAWVPLLIMLLGIGEISKIALIALGTFFIVNLHVAHAIRDTEKQYIELAQVLGKGGAELLLCILLPAATPQIFTGLRVAMGLSWTLLLVAEIIASSQGLGWLIWDSRNFSRPDELFVGMIAVGVLGRLTDWLLLLLERYLTGWRSTLETWQDDVERLEYSH